MARTKNIFQCYEFNEALSYSSHKQNTAKDIDSECLTLGLCLSIENIFILHRMNIYLVEIYFTILWHLILNGLPFFLLSKRRSLGTKRKCFWYDIDILWMVRGKKFLVT